MMPSQSRPDVDVLEGLTTAIIVDQEDSSLGCVISYRRPGNPRHQMWSLKAIVATMSLERSHITNASGVWKLVSKNFATT